MITSDSLLNILAQLALIIPAFLLAVTVHEFSHAAVADALGDETPRKAGRYSLNPFKHVDPMGLLFLVLFRVGWAQPVPFNPNNFRHPRFYGILTGLAGPLSNFCLALIFLYFTKYLPTSLLPIAAIMSAYQLFNTIVYVNIMLGVFNLLPIPPLDGSHVVYALLPKALHSIYFFIARYAIFIFIILFYFPSIRIEFIQAIEKVKTFLQLLVI
jgi:Zn-dependent protease